MRTPSWGRMSPPVSPTSRVDVAVVGAGPAGALAALSLARAGHRVTLLEKQRVPRDKTCGDALIPDAQHALAGLGLLERVDARAHAASTFRFYAPGGATFDVQVPCLTLPRQQLDALLVEAAVEAGATLWDGAEAEGFEATPDAARLTVRRHGGGAEVLGAQLAILACGASVATLRRFGLQHRTAPSAVALRGYYELEEGVPEDVLHVWYERPVLPGYAWLFPLGERRFNVGAGVFYDASTKRPDLGSVFRRFAEQCPEARRLLASGRELREPVGAPLRTRLTGCQTCADRLLVAGEAIGTTYSFTGEGIGKAMETGLAAADAAASALASGRTAAADLAGYGRGLDARLRPLFRDYARAQGWLQHPWVVDLVVSRAARSPRVRALFADVLCERRRPSALLSWHGLLRAALLP